MSDIFYMTGKAMIHVSIMTFPGGEVGVNVNQHQIDPEVDHVTIYARLRDANGVMALLLAKDALERVYPFAKFYLRMGYIPYARQDRVCNPGEALSAKVFANLINAQKFETVVVIDPHSSVSTCLLDRCMIVPQYMVFKNIYRTWDHITILAPDAGALKKAEEFAQVVNAKGVVHCVKKRNMADGKIIGQEIIDEINPHGHYFMLDDICDGGRTFLGVFNAMTEKGFDPSVGKVELAVTHGIFSNENQLNMMRHLFHNIHTSDTFRAEVDTPDCINVIHVL